jgi:protein O-mannosyl-transferase
MKPRRPPKAQPSGKNGDDNVLHVCGKGQRGGNASNYAAFAIACVAVGVFFSSALDNGFINFDDKDYVYENPLIKDWSFKGIGRMFTSFYASNYHPLTALSNAVEYRFFGANPMVYHFVNVALHAVVSFLVFLFLAQLVPDRFAAMVGMLLFAVHPLRVESVVWVSERKDLLYSLFYLAAMIWYIRKREHLLTTRNYGVLLLLFAFSLLSKSAAVVLPCSLIAIEQLLSPRISLKKTIFTLSPLFALSLVFGIIALKSQNASQSAANIASWFSITDKAVMTLHAFGFYFWKTLLPVQLSALYYYPEKISGALPPLYYLSAILVLGSAVAAAALLHKKRWFVFAALFYTINLILVIQIVSVGQAMMSDRYSYMPSIALSYLAALAIWKLKLLPSKNTGTILPVVGTIIVVVALGTASLQRSRVWKNSITFSTELIKQYPKRAFGYYLRGDAYLNERNDPVNALRDLSAALRLEPSMVWAYVTRAVAYIKQNDYQAALDDCLRAYSIDPALQENLQNLGYLYVTLGAENETRSNITGADSCYTEALKYRPALVSALMNRGRVRAMSGRLQEALADFSAVLRIEPGNFDAHINRGNTRAMAGLYRESIEDYDTSIEMNPHASQSYFNRGLSKMNLGDTTGGCEDWRIAGTLGNGEAEAAALRYCR